MRACTRDNIRRGGLMVARRSPFLCAIREQPGLLRRHRYACALFEHRTELDALIAKLDAQGGKNP